MKYETQGELMPESRPNTPEINPWIVAIAVMLGTFMEVLDTTVVNVALPHIAGSLSATVDETTWVLTSYLVSNAIILPMTGWLANQFGRKRILLLSVFGFTVASLACGLAPNLPRSLSSESFRALRAADYNHSLKPSCSKLSAGASRKGDGLLGTRNRRRSHARPVLGGWITDTYSWRWVFYINLPVGIMATIMARLFVFDPPYIGKKSEYVDYIGMAFLVIGIGSLQVFLDKGQTEDWWNSNFIKISP
jgi:DHA2 family multidrug resistance protein